ncbi:chromosome segregation ATPase [Devosia nitrariae]|uniref:Chromosome segregation ATPase n=2 Tax=Devosia nitrariae TaxID=2071872 RepID=A0ABQ5VZ58_9HYPH|nr:chromosome segregation ATPase [Devosia nitrariae]
MVREHWRWKRIVAAERAKRSALEQRFSSIIDADTEAARIVEVATSEAEKRESESKALVTSLGIDIARLNSELGQVRLSYREKKAIFDRLAKEVAVFDERLAFAEMGVYEPHFDFDTSEDFKEAIVRVRDRQKAMVSNKAAVVCRTQWTVDGSAARGRTMTERNVRLTLRAFNSECDAAIANTRWNNANAMEKRIENARNQIDKHNASSQVEITQTYFQLKLDELRLTHEYREKAKQEREERADEARAAREEQKLIREMERAEEEEARYERMLQKAKAEAASVVGPKLEAYSQQIAILERDLAEAHAKVERARAMAEMTRTGYVYVISNIGSFGPDLVKIGLTRRLDPADRIRELGDASVPFLFDTHAMIYSEDAPALERALHTEFAAQRVNATNMRKEFFRVSIEEVEATVKRLAPAAAFFRDIEAQEYHETRALRNAHLTQQTINEELAFPEAL